MRNLLFCCLSIACTLQSACICPKKEDIPETPLPDSVRAYIPYQSEQHFFMRHSGGSLLDFTVNSRNLEHLRGSMGCAECCQEYYRYQSDQTRISSTFPRIDLELRLDNSFVFDKGLHPMDFSIDMNGLGGFAFPLDSLQHSSLYIDSLRIKDTVYREVYDLHYGYSIDSTILKAEHLYYNTSSGIIKILLNNKESYELEK